MTNKRIYKFGNSTLILEFGDITESTAQVLDNLRKLLGSLEDQRYKIEAQVIAALNDPSKKAEIKTLREKLRENEELRLSYYSELKVLSDKEASSSQNTPTVWIH
jgi:hypothetical protein